jgi:O-antigen ligase
LLWGHALGFIEFNIQNNFSTFLFGTGDSTLQGLLTQYLNSVGSIEEMQKSVGNQMSLNDFHNLYLDSTVRMGLIYTVGYLSLMGFVLLSLGKKVLNGNKLSWMGISLLLTYLGIGTVYSNNLEFQTAIVFLILALCVTWPKSNTSAANCNKVD